MRKVIVSLFLLFIIGNLQASSLSSSFEEAFKSTTIQSGGAGQFSAGGRTIHSGGYVRIRIPTVAGPNPIKVQAPAIRGGCNGFDLYGGSFSYIEADEILAWLNAVIQNSGALATYMFLTFLQEQCSVCSEIMQTLYAMQDMLNMTMQDSCTTANALVSGLNGDGQAWDAYKQGVVESAKRVGNSAGKVGGTVSSWYKDPISVNKQAEENVADIVSKATSDAEERVRSVTGGNPLMLAIRDGNLLDIFRKRFKDNTLTTKQLYVYLVAFGGSYIVDLNADGSAGGDDGSLKRNIDIKVNSIESFIDGTYVNFDADMDCNDELLCLNPTTISFKDGFADVKPFAKNFVCMMEGADLNGATCGDGVGIVKKLGRKEGESGKFTTDELDFYQTFSSRVPVVAMLEKVASSKTAKDMLYLCLKENLIIDFAWAEILFAYENLINGLKIVAVSDGSAASVRNHYLQSVERNFEKLKAEYASKKNKTVNPDTQCSSVEVDLFLQARDLLGDK